VQVGVIADTHGYLDPRLAAAFAGVDAIVLAGDVGGALVLDALRALAPLHAVYGNNDEKLGGLGLRLREDFDLAGVRFHLVHQLPYATPCEDTGVVVFGHSHRTLIERPGDVLYLNPGAAGRVGFHRLQTVALMRIARGRVADARIVELGPRLASAARPAAGARTQRARR
jgi:putative phosphoesterase